MNYLCKGYKTFYSHTLPYFEKMAVCLRAKRPASDWNQWGAYYTDRPNDGLPGQVETIPGPVETVKNSKNVTEPKGR